MERRIFREQGTKSCPSLRRNALNYHMSRVSKKSGVYPPVAFLCFFLVSRGCSQKGQLSGFGPIVFRRGPKYAARAPNFFLFLDLYLLVATLFVYSKTNILSPNLRRLMMMGRTRGLHNQISFKIFRKIKISPKRLFAVCAVEIFISVVVSRSAKRRHKLNAKWRNLSFGLYSLNTGFYSFNWNFETNLPRGLWSRSQFFQNHSV